MKETEQKRLEKPSKLSTPQPLKRMIPQLLLSVSIFSFVFSYSYLLHPPISHYLSSNYNFQPLNKNCIFLICNGILVLLAKTSGLTRPPSSVDLDEMMKGMGIGLQTAVEPPIENHVLEASDEPEKAKGNECLSVGGRPKEVSIFITQSRDHEEGGGGACEFQKWWPFDDVCAEQLHGQEEEETDELLSTEELNQQFEDFIKRMKEDIMMVNQQKQLVLPS